MAMTFLAVRAEFCPQPPNSGRNRPNLAKWGLPGRIRATCAQIWVRPRPDLGRLRLSLGRVRPTPTNFGPGSTTDLPVIGQIWADVDQCWPVFDEFVGPEVDQNCTGFDQIGRNSARIRRSSAKDGPKSTSSDQRWPGIHQRWPEVDQLWPDVSQL